MHSIEGTQKILTFMSWTGERRQQKHTQHAPSTKTKCDYLNFGLENGHRHKNLTRNGESQRDSWKAEEEEEDQDLQLLSSQSGSTLGCLSRSVHEIPVVILSYLSSRLADRWGTTVDFTTSFLHFSRFSAFRSMIFHSRPVHSLMLSSHRYFCLPLRLPP